ncbi:helix-turn-helix domain-containing protein [Aurantiacibacter sp. D1-12]|uniref:helix-turn-helix domain-containing protein n=1 Tax=Aurantiacibacter sp. D1-12 TaxID=2993658 RepID=UPI00237CD4A6|nr:helix-turn-helix domain-containing protein [Aurantiacibacter sp. D1-12]MDE1468088.1 helix-turn-helix domain-containing protein [Aurantiacibacter sp. D1-12]
MSLPFSLTYYDPPEHLRRHLTVLFHWSTEVPVVKDRHSGALGQLNIFPLGKGEMAFENYTQKVEAKANLTSGCSYAPKFTMYGPWHSIGATLTPLGWASLTRVPASDHVDRYFPAAELLGEDIDAFADNLSRDYNAGVLPQDQACFMLGDWIAERLQSVPAQHELLIERTIGWLGGALNPDLEQLFDLLPYSRRQAERLVERYFGFPPAAVARKYRAVRAAALLSQEDLTDQEEAAIADAFYDQPHMVKEIARYCGYTPSRLGGEGQTIMTTLMQMKNFDRLQAFRARTGE